MTPRSSSEKLPVSSNVAIRSRALRWKWNPQEWHTRYRSYAFEPSRSAPQERHCSWRTGTSSSPLKYLFFVSDGVADEQNTGCLKPTTGGGRCQSPIDPSLCTTLKNRGIKIAVLYTTYLQLTTNAWYMSWIDPFNTGPFGPSPNSEIAKNMASCASPGLYFEVSPTQGISAAMDALFKKAIADARIAS